MLRKVLRVVALALPLLAVTAVTAARIDPPTPDCFPCDDGNFVGQILLP
jgi:hypothetical protein